MKAGDMTHGWIDSATLGQLLQALTKDHTAVPEWSEWDTEVSVDLTATLIGTNEFRIAPGLGPSGPASGDYGALAEGLKEQGAIAVSAPPSDAAHRDAM